MNESFCQYFHKSDDIDKYSCNSHCNSAHNWNIPVLAYFILPRTAQGTLALGKGIKKTRTFWRGGPAERLSDGPVYDPRNRV